MSTLPEHLFVIIILSIFIRNVCGSMDNQAMQDFRKHISSSSSRLGWVDSNPCKWKSIDCSDDSRVVGIRVGNLSLEGTLPPNLNLLAFLEYLNVENNGLTGPLPDISGLDRLVEFNARGNFFSGRVPASFSTNPSLRDLALGHNLLQGQSPIFRASVQVDAYTTTNNFCSDVSSEKCDPRVENSS